MSRYTKGIAALLTAVAATIGIEIEESFAAQLVTFVGALAVYLVPNRR